MKTAEQILKEKYMDDRNLKEDGPTLIPHVMLEAMEEYAQQRVEEYQKEFHNKLMVKFEQDFGSIHNSISMDAYTISGFVRSALIPLPKAPTV